MTNYVSNINTIPIGGDNFDNPCFIPSSRLSILDGVTLAGGKLFTYSIANLLPEDSSTYDYEVTFSGLGRSAATSGNVTQLVLLSGTHSTDDGTGLRLNRVQIRNANHSYAGGSAILPIFHTDRNITVFTQDSSTNNANVQLWIVYYRRLGWNP